MNCIAINTGQRKTPMVKFLNAVPWGGLYFCYSPGQIIDLDADTADAREKLGLGKVVKDKSQKPVEPVSEPATAAPEPSATLAPKPLPDAPEPPVRPVAVSPRATVTKTSA
jgi:hypothetical protein